MTEASLATREIGAALGRMTNAWNDGDAAAYAGQFTEDADYVTFFGLHMTGRQAIEDSHRALFEGPLKGSRLTGVTSPSIRFLRPDVAVVVAGGGSSLDGVPDPGRDSVITLTAVREPDAWRFASFQNTRRTNPAAPAGPPTRR
ncbi:SgcJ/EcaC family oxidoreductase [Streptosporangium sandarakinum]|uniref:SgcJ/EcaC family oxidoreductase n=1 Tax=Streptosporangium sandarakinum TaxID=1260955 RepID=UPI00339E93DE